MSIRFSKSRLPDTGIRNLTAGVTGKGGIWRMKPPDAESAVGAATLKVRAAARTCPVHAVCATRSLETGINRGMSGKVIVP